MSRHTDRLRGNASSSLKNALHFSHGVELIQAHLGGEPIFCPAVMG